MAAALEATRGQAQASSGWPPNKPNTAIQRRNWWRRFKRAADTAIGTKVARALRPDAWLPHPDPVDPHPWWHPNPRNRPRVYQNPFEELRPGRRKTTVTSPKTTLHLTGFPVLENGTLAPEAQETLDSAVAMLKGGTLKGDAAQEYLEGVLMGGAQATMEPDQAKAFLATTLAAARDASYPLLEHQARALLNATLRNMMYARLNSQESQTLLNVSLNVIPYQKLTSTQAQAFLNASLAIAPRKDTSFFELKAFADATYAATRAAYQKWTPAALTFVTLKGLSQSNPDHKREIEEVIPNLPPPLELHNYYKGTDQHVDYYWSGKNGDMQRSGSTQFLAPNKLELGPSWTWRDGFNDVVRTAPLVDGDRNIFLTTLSGRILKQLRPGGTLRG